LDSIASKWQPEFQRASISFVRCCFYSGQNGNQNLFWTAVKTNIDQDLLDQARNEIIKSWAETCQINNEKEGFNQNKLPKFYDPFSGGGAIPLEAQRLGLEALASDLNPIPVLINRAVIQIPPTFSGKAPISLSHSNGHDKNTSPVFEKDWLGSEGFAVDLKYYSDFIYREAYRQIGEYYPKIVITKEIANKRKDLKNLTGEELTVIAWIWARTVKSPNPAFNSVDVPLIKSFVLSSKKGKEAWLKPIIIGDSYSFKIMTGKYSEDCKNGTKLSRGANFRCILSETPITPKYIKTEGKAGRIGHKVVAVVAKGNRGRIYLQATHDIESLAKSAKPKWKPKGNIPKKLTGGTCYGYGLDEWHKLFTKRQLLALNTFSDLIIKTREKVITDAKRSGWVNNGLGLYENGDGATAYADAIVLYLSFALDKMADLGNTLVRWEHIAQCPRQLFARQAIPMIWDFAEPNVFSGSSGSWPQFIDGIIRGFKTLSEGTGKNKAGVVLQLDAQNSANHPKMTIISTDPPYYDNISYADLSDFFYVWSRKTLRTVFPDVFATIATPKDEELVATAYRHGDKKSAEEFFLKGMTEALKNLVTNSHPAFPVTIYYAFKQEANTASTGWETFLEAVIKSGFTITGTWPMRTENVSRMIGHGTNSLASSIVLVCRKNKRKIPSISRRNFQRELKETLPDALEVMIGGEQGVSPIAPVDLAQASIGPGMAIFSKYSAVLEADGSPMSVHDALIQINREIDDYFNAAEGDLDPDSRFCIDWFQQYGFKTGSFGEADVVARAKGTSVDAVADSGVIKSGGGKVQLLTFSDYPKEWNPDKDPKIPIWEATHQLIRALRQGGEKESGFLLSRLPGKTEKIRQLAYRLYTLCERQGWAEEARAYNELISSWHGIVSASEDIGIKGEQMELF